jgi:hypothetical protein
MPWSINLDGAAVDIEPLDDGEAELVLTPIAVGAGRVAMMPPQVRVRFGPEGFETFCGLVAQARSPIQVARVLPPEPQGAS